MSLERILRLVVANGFAEQTAAREYLPTKITTQMTKRGSIGCIETMSTSLPLKKIIYRTVTKYARQGSWKYYR